MATSFPDMTQPDDFSDVILVVEERKLYSSKSILSCSSPVWRTMFTSDFKEKTMSTIPLPGKKFNDIKELLWCITPGVVKPITDHNVSRILPLVDEYQMERLRSDCAKNLELTIMFNWNIAEVLLRCLVLAEKYGCNGVVDSCVRRLSEDTNSLADMENCSLYQRVEPKTQARILTNRVHALEEKNRILTKNCKNWERKYTRSEESSKDILQKYEKLSKSKDKLRGVQKNIFFKPKV